MEKERILVSRDQAAIDQHINRLHAALVRFQKLIELYFSLKLDEHSRSLMEITNFQNTFQKCREQVRKGLPPSLRDTSAVESILLSNEPEFFALLSDMKKSGDLEYTKSFLLNREGEISINQEAIRAVEEQNSLYLTDLRVMDLLKTLVEDLNAFEMYARKTYHPYVSLTGPGPDGGIHLNDRWHLCNQDSRGNLVLNESILAVFEEYRK